MEACRKIFIEVNVINELIRRIRRTPQMRPESPDLSRSRYSAISREQ
jgi:hypothetical protein